MKSKKIFILLILVLMIPIIVFADSAGMNAGLGDARKKPSTNKPHEVSWTPLNFSGVRISVMYSETEASWQRVSSVVDFVRPTQAIECASIGSKFFQKCNMNFLGNDTLYFNDKLSRNERVTLNMQGNIYARTSMTSDSGKDKVAVYSWDRLTKVDVRKKNTIANELLMIITNERKKVLLAGNEYEAIFNYENLPDELKDLFKVINFVPSKDKTKWQNYYILVEPLVFIERLFRREKSYYYGSATDIITMTSGEELEEKPNLTLANSHFNFENGYGLQNYVKVRKQNGQYYHMTAGLQSIEKLKYNSSGQVILEKDGTPKTYFVVPSDPNHKVILSGYYTKPVDGVIYGVASGHVWLGADENEPVPTPQGCDYDLDYSMPGDCDVSNSGYVHDAGDDNDEEQWKCIFDSTGSGNSSISSRYTTSQNNRYCSVMCREDIDYILPNNSFVAMSGTRFTINNMNNIGGINFKGISSCRSKDNKINHELFKTDFEVADKAVRSAYSKLDIGKIVNQGINTEGCIYYVNSWYEWIRDDDGIRIDKEPYDSTCQVQVGTNPIYNAKGKQIGTTPVYEEQPCIKYRDVEVPIKIPVYSNTLTIGEYLESAPSNAKLSSNVAKNGIRYYSPSFTYTLSKGSGYASFSNVTFSGLGSGSYTGNASTSSVNVGRYTGNTCAPSISYLSYPNFTSGPSSELTSAQITRNNFVDQITSCNNFMRIYGEFNPEVTFSYDEPKYGGKYNLKAQKAMTAYTDYYKNDHKVESSSWNTSIDVNSTSSGYKSFPNLYYGATSTLSSWNCVGTICSNGTQTYQTNDYVRAYTVRDNTFDLDPSRQYYHYIAKGSGISYHTLEELKNSGSTDYYYLGYNNLPIGYSTPGYNDYKFNVNFTYSLDGKLNLFGRNQKFFNILIGNTNTSIPDNTIYGFIYKNAKEYIKDGNTGDHTMPIAFSNKLGSRLNEFKNSSCYADYGCSEVDGKIKCTKFKTTMGNWKNAETNENFRDVYRQLDMCISDEVDFGSTAFGDAISEYNCPFTIENNIVPPKEGLNVVYRPIDLNKPFPGEKGIGRNRGSNWSDPNDVKKYIHENRGVSEAEVYNLTPMYQFILTPANILEIRRYNDTRQNDKNGGYADFELDCIKGAGEKCRSGFLKNGNDKYFEFTKANPSGGVCYNVTDDQWEACRYKEAVIK